MNIAVDTNILFFCVWKPERCRNERHRELCMRSRDLVAKATRIFLAPPSVVEIAHISQRDSNDRQIVSSVLEKVQCIHTSGLAAKIGADIWRETFAHDRICKKCHSSIPKPNAGPCKACGCTKHVDALRSDLLIFGTFAAFTGVDRLYSFDSGMSRWSEDDRWQLEVCEPDPLNPQLSLLDTGMLPSGDEEVKGT